MEQNDTNTPLDSSIFGDSSLTYRQIQAIPHIIAASSLERAAKDARVSRSTLYRWMSDPEFRAELKRMREAAAELGYEMLRGLVLKSVSTLNEIVKDEHAPVGARLRAARATIELALKAEEQFELKRRIDLLNGAFQVLKTQQ